MVVNAPERSFDPTTFEAFRFVSRELAENGRVTLRYALDEEIEFVERFELPVRAPVSATDRRSLEGLLSLLHWVAGVSYFKTAAPADVRCDSGAPPPATAALLEALYSEGLGEFAYVNALPELPRPSFPHGPPLQVPARAPRSRGQRGVLVPVGG